MTSMNNIYLYYIGFIASWIIHREAAKKDVGDLYRSMVAHCYQTFFLCIFSKKFYFTFIKIYENKNFYFFYIY